MFDSQRNKQCVFVYGPFIPPAVSPPSSPPRLSPASVCLTSPLDFISPFLILDYPQTTNELSLGLFFFFFFFLFELYLRHMDVPKLGAE